MHHYIPHTAMENQVTRIGSDGRIEITDANANTICFVGRRGGPDPRALTLGWPTVVAASDAALYIADYLHFRILRARFDYTKERARTTKVPMN